MRWWQLHSWLAAANWDAPNARDQSVGPPLCLPPRLGKLNCDDALQRGPEGVLVQQAAVCAPTPFAMQGIAHHRRHPTMGTLLAWLPPPPSKVQVPENVHAGALT